MSPPFFLSFFYGFLISLFFVSCVFVFMSFLGRVFVEGVTCFFFFYSSSFFFLALYLPFFIYFSRLFVFLVINRSFFFNCFEVSSFFFFLVVA